MLPCQIWEGFLTRNREFGCMGNRVFCSVWSLKKVRNPKKVGMEGFRQGWGYFGNGGGVTLPDLVG